MQTKNFMPRKTNINIRNISCSPQPVSMLSRGQRFGTPWTVAHQTSLSMEFPGKNTGVGCHFLLQVIFPTQASNPRLLHLLYRQADSSCCSTWEVPHKLHQQVNTQNIVSISSAEIFTREQLQTKEKD